MTEAHWAGTTLANGDQAPEEPKGAENMLPNNNDAMSGATSPCSSSMDAPAHAGPEARQKRVQVEEEQTEERDQKRMKVEHVEVKSESGQDHAVVTNQVVKGEIMHDAAVKQEEGLNAEGKKQEPAAPAAPAEVPAAAAAEDPPKPIELPKPDLEIALQQLESVCGKKVALGTRLEVCWEVVDDENEEEDETPPIWWECEIKELVGGHAAYTGVWMLAYDSKEVDGKEFPAEERKVTFCARNMLIDIESEHGSIGGGDKGLMQWRFEGSGDTLLPLLSRGSSVKARCRGGESWHAGQVFDVNHDGTYQISYEDGDFDENVPREHIEPVEEVADLDESDVVAEDIDSFFELFTARLTGGEMFQRLDPDKQRIASEKINSMRPLFREELEKIRDARGMGTTISGDDIAALIPTVMQRRAELDREEKAAAVPAA